MAPTPAGSPTIENSFEFAFALLAMLVSSYTVDRFSHGRIPAKWVAVAVGVFLVVFFGTGTHQTLMKLLAIVRTRGTSLFSPVGIQGFCGDLQKLAEAHMFQVLLMATALYLTLQTFCIPGTIALNAALGALLGTAVGVPLAVILGTIGASCCYLLSTAFGSKLADAVDHRLMRGKGVPRLRAAVQRYRADLLVYMLFLRLTPVLPNWLVNLASPIVHVPLKTFAMATCLGIIPQSYLSVRFGSVVVAAQQRFGSSAGEGGAGAKELPPIVTTADQIFLCAAAVLLVITARLRKRLSTASSSSGAGATSVPV